MALSFQFFSFIAQQNNNEVWLRPQLNGNSESACKVFPSLKNINGILVRWVVSLDADKSKQYLDASVSKIQNVSEHCFQALFKLCFTNWSMSEQGPTDNSPRITETQVSSHSYPPHELRWFKCIYTAQTLVFWVVHTRIIFIRLQIYPLWRPFTLRKSEKMHVITWRLLTLMDSTSVYGASCPTQEVAINFLFKWSQKSTISWTYLADYPVCKIKPLYLMQK